MSNPIFVAAFERRQALKSVVSEVGGMDGSTTWQQFDEALSLPVATLFPVGSAVRERLETPGVFDAYAADLAALADAKARRDAAAVSEQAEVDAAQAKVDSY
jgi:hypothetical protein